MYLFVSRTRDIGCSPFPCANIFHTILIEEMFLQVLFAMQFIKTLPVSIFIVLLGIIPMNHPLDRDISIARIGFRPFYWNTTGPPRPSRHVTEEQGSETFDRNCSYFMECDGEVIYYDYKNANPGVGCSGSWTSNGFERHCLNFMIANLPNSFDWWLCTGGSDPFHDAHFERVVQALFKRENLQF